uniref:Uncharacterized protein n=1 Tax=Anguilla anguilla TaxID=7936 RepID=A0A0E9QSU1_ANGAN
MHSLRPVNHVLILIQIFKTFYKNNFRN